MVQQQALFAAMEQRASEYQQQHAEQKRRYSDLEQVLDRTAKDLDQLREEHQKAIDELRLLRLSSDNCFCRLATIRITG